MDIDNNARYIDGHLIVEMINYNSKFECFQALLNGEGISEKRTVFVKLFNSEIAFEDELMLQEKLIHSNITSMIAYKRQGIFSDSGGERFRPYIMMEYFDFEIFNFISSKQKPALTEGVIWFLFKQIISAIQKYEEAEIKDVYLNLIDISKLLMFDTKTMQIKLPDILSETYILKKVTKVKRQNNYNIPPELSPCKLVQSNVKSLILKDKSEYKGAIYPYAPLVYSAGILLFNLATGNGFDFKSVPPLFSPNYDRITRSAKLWRSLLNQQKTPFTLTDSLKDLIEKMLDYNSNTRITIQDILKHSWYETIQILDEEYFEYCRRKVESIIQELIEYDASEAYKLKNVSECSITRSENFKFSSCRRGSSNNLDSEECFKEGKFNIYSHYTLHRQLIHLKLQNVKSSNMMNMVYDLVKAAFKFEGIDFYRGSNSALECTKNMRQADYLISDLEEELSNETTSNEQTTSLTVFKFKCELYFDVNDLQYTIALLAEDNPHYLWDVCEGIKNGLYRAKS